MMNLYGQTVGLALFSGVLKTIGRDLKIANYVVPFQLRVICKGKLCNEMCLISFMKLFSFVNSFPGTRT